MNLSVLDAVTVLGVALLVMVAVSNVAGAIRDARIAHHTRTNPRPGTRSSSVTTPGPDDQPTNGATLPAYGGRIADGTPDERPGAPR